MIGLQWADIDALLHARSDLKILDVGCGIGGSSRYLHKRFQADVVGITLSRNQQRRAEELNRQQQLEPHVRIMIADALILPFPDSSFDLVWSMESGEHMPDKAKFFSEMVRVLKPGGALLLATWCIRAPIPGDGGILPAWDRKCLDAVYRQWALPYFIPVESYREMAISHSLNNVRFEDWSSYVKATWWHAVTVGARDLPFLLSCGVHAFLRSLRDVHAIYYMVQGYNRGLIRYGIVTARKPSGK